MSNQLERLQFICEQITEKGRISKNDIIKSFKVCKRTVLYDINYLQVEKKAPLISVVEKGITYYLFSDKFRLFKDDLGNPDIKDNFNFMYSMLKSNLYIPYCTETVIKKTFHAVKTDGFYLNEHILFKTQKVEEYNVELLRKIIHIMCENKQIKLSYFDNDEIINQQVETYQIINYNAVYYLLCYSIDTKMLLTLPLSSITSVETTNEKVMPIISKEAINRICTENFGLPNAQVSTKQMKVKIRFYNHAAKTNVKTIFHKDQVVTGGSNDTNEEFIEFCFYVVQFEEVLHIVLQYGADAEIIEPKQLKNLWISSIEDAYSKFCKR